MGNKKGRLQPWSADRAAEIKRFTLSVRRERDGVTTLAKVGRGGGAPRRNGARVTQEGSRTRARERAGGTPARPRRRAAAHSCGRAFG